MRSRSILTAILLAVLMAAVCFAFSTAHSYAATGTAVWVTEENSAGQITSVKLDMSSMTGCSQYHVIIKRDDIQILQENVTSSIYDVTDKVLSYDSGIFQAEGFAYKAGAFTEFGTEDLKFFTITIDRQGHGNSFKLNHIKNGTSVKTALKNGYISTFDTGGDDMLMRYYENEEAFEGVALHPLSNYSDIEALKEEACYLLPGGSGKNYNLGGDVTVYDIWLKVITDVELTVQVPACCDTTSTSKAGEEWNWDGQTNPPVVTIPSGKGYHYQPPADDTGSWWIKSVEEDDEPFVGTFTGGNSYAFQSAICSDFGYVFPADKDSIKLTVKVNGQAIPRGNAYNGNMPYSFSVIDGGTVPLNIDGTVAVEHTLLVTPGKPATLTEDGITEGVSCTKCEQKLAEATLIPHPAEFSLTGTSFVFNGKAQNPAAIVKDANGNVIPSSNYSVSYENNTNAGQAAATILFDGVSYDGCQKVTFDILRAANPLSVKGKTVSLKAKKVKKKTQTLAVTKVITFAKTGQGAMTYIKKSGHKKITINNKTGKVTVKKGLKKGTYKVVVKAKAAGNANYMPSAEKLVTFKIRIK